MCSWLSSSSSSGSSRLRAILLVAVCIAGTGAAHAAAYKVLVFSATAGFRHPSITNGIAAIQTLGASNNCAVDATEDASWFTDATLAQYKAVIFLCTTGDVPTNSTPE